MTLISNNNSNTMSSDINWDIERARRLLIASMPKSASFFEEHWGKLLHKKPPEQHKVTLSGTDCRVDLHRINPATSTGFCALFNVLNDSKCTSLRLVRFPSKLSERCIQVWKNIFSEAQDLTFPVSIEIDPESELSENVRALLAWHASPGTSQDGSTQLYKLSRKLRHPIQVAEISAKNRLAGIVQWLSQPRSLDEVSPKFKKLLEDIHSPKSDTIELLHRLKTFPKPLVDCDNHMLLSLFNQESMCAEISKLSDIRQRLINQKAHLSITAAQFRHAIKEELFEAWIQRFFTIEWQPGDNDHLFTTLSQAIGLPPNIDLRKELANFMLEHPQKYMREFENYNELTNHCTQMKHLKEIGGELELQAFVDYCEIRHPHQQVKLTIFDVTLLPSIELDEYKQPVSDLTFQNKAQNQSMEILLYRRSSSGINNYVLLTPKAITVEESEQDGDIKHHDKRQKASNVHPTLAIEAQSNT